MTITYQSTIEQTSPNIIYYALSLSSPFVAFPPIQFSFHLTFIYFFPSHYLSPPLTYSFPCLQQTHTKCQRRSVNTHSTLFVNFELCSALIWSSDPDSVSVAIPLSLLAFWLVLSSWLSHLPGLGEGAAVHRKGRHLPGAPRTTCRRIDERGRSSIPRAVAPPSAKLRCLLVVFVLLQRIKSKESDRTRLRSRPSVLSPKAFLLWLFLPCFLFCRKCHRLIFARSLYKLNSSEKLSIPGNN